ncbi:DUF262 domain-containing protein [Tumebacillus flagellatus]|uniref:DUF262 domain-containing protein n=1 Tax=Tumebacillus flagellatus TaxID=1157490 RepID=A0A074LUV3_9BACL|nr:DUF262 domain-containing protein [Tumebacillus flagellatus]KEO84709.1 hypothetical protein EL26_04110 [Tumebacillus flagellatus]
MKISAHGKNLQKILAERVTYEIPDYQRPYSWTKHELEDMLNDLDVTITSETNHYFGTFVFNEERKKSDNVIEVIDGQQRMTTVAIFLYVLRYLYSQPRFSTMEGVEHRRNKLKEYLEFLDEDGQTIGSKFRLGDVNREFFDKYIVEGWAKEATEKEAIVKSFENRKLFNASKSIKTAFEFIQKKIDDRIAGLNDAEAIQQIKQLNDAILKDFEVVEIVVEQDGDAFLIFETLNDRGLELSSVDLIKNKLFKYCAHHRDFEELKDKWLDMIRTLDNSVVKKYLRHYWIATYEHTTHQGLFKSVRDRVTDYSFAKRLILDLHNLSQYYGALINPHNGCFTNQKLIVVLEEMRSLGFDLLHPILLSAFRKFNNDETKLYKIARLCLNFLLRYITVMKEKPSNIEKEVGECARNLDNDLTQLAAVFIKHAKDAEFKESMKLLTVNYSSYSTYFILAEYEHSLHNEMWIAPERKYVTVEHILPQVIDFDKSNEVGEWANKFSQEEHDVYLNRLGNLTLLGPSPQGKAGNRRFEDKLRVYQNDTSMLMTHELTNYATWGIEQIEDRQEKMAEKAVDIFTLDYSHVK